MKNRIEIALDFLRDGQPFTVGDLRLSMQGIDVLSITGWSQFLNYSNITKKSSLMELEEIKNIFLNMLEVSDNLKYFIADKSLEYILCYDDGGKASIDICSEKNGVIKWLVELK